MDDLPCPPRRLCDKCIQRIDRGLCEIQPINQLIKPSGEAIPTLDAGTTLDRALMETVFHDVPYSAGPKMLSKAKHVEGWSRSSLRLIVDLALIDLSTISLRKLGISRAELIDTDGSHYGETRRWAIALYEQLSLPTHRVRGQRSSQTMQNSAYWFYPFYDLQRF